MNPAGWDFTIMLDALPCNRLLF